jgi:starch phosphorylase
VTPRRFVALANPGLARLITDAVGDGWLTDLDRLARLAPLADDAGFRARWREVRTANKRALAAWLAQRTGRQIDPASLVDAQCKRIHEYKRQHLNLLHAVWLHRRIRRGDTAGLSPRTVLFAGKAAPAYWMAKLIIKLATAVGDTLAADPAVAGFLRGRPNSV